MTDTGPRGAYHGVDWDALPYGGDLYGELHLADSAPPPAEPAPAPSWLAQAFPGLAASAAGAITAAWLADHYHFPIILLGLLVGLSLNFLSGDARTHKGLDFAARTCLRWGIVVLGMQVTYAQIQALGVTPLAALLVVMAATLVAGLAGARLVGQSVYAGLLAGGATAICGASAALALYGVIGRQRLPQAQFALTLVGISLASAFAMTAYPMLAAELGLNDRQAGFLIGASIHDVAQAIGGGYAFSDAAGSAATIVKLARVALLAPLVAVTSLVMPGGDGAPRGWRAMLPPWFITAFIGVVAAHSLLPLPQPVVSAALTGSKAMLLLAVTATAMRTRLDLLLAMGWRAAVPVVTATLASFATALGLALALG
ncbi:MAG: putative sulfate exporter family transporter [Proteobacteria bacterium]|nr:putative sulfate exporter family transporter [Pseudomonadota bacterium]